MSQVRQVTACVRFSSVTESSICLVGVIRVDSAMPVACPVSGSFRKYWVVVDGVALVVIRAPKLEPRIMRYYLSGYEWSVIKPMLPDKPRGVPRVNDRRVLNGLFWVLRSGAP